MVMSMILSTMMSISMMMIIMKHPMSMGLLLIMQTIMTSLLSGMMMNMFWTSYILLISMVSGMLVLFIYMSMIASNEKFMSNTIPWGVILMTMMMVFLFWKEKMIIKNNYLSMEMSLFPLNKMFMLETMNMTIMMVLYLFLTMIVSSYLVNIYEGPMRSKPNYE